MAAVKEVSVETAVVAAFIRTSWPFFPLKDKQISLLSGKVVLVSLLARGFVYRQPL